jgi:hypothetical protein
MGWLDDFDWKAALKVIAPTVAGLVAAPVGFGPLANAGMRAILDAAFPDEDHSKLAPPEVEEKLASALASGQLTPEQMAAMKQADYAFQQRIAELKLEEMKVDAADRDSARKREMTVKDRIPAILAGVTSVGFFVTLGFLFFVVPPDNNSEIIYLLVGQGIVATYLMIYNYYFGSSSGSIEKTRALADAAKGTAGLRK